MVPASKKKSKVDCISAGHEGTDLRMLVWNKMDECTDARLNMRTQEWYGLRHIPLLRRRPK